MKISERDAAKSMGKVFQVRREMIKLLRENVISGTGLGWYEIADMLVDLYGATKLDWPEPASFKGKDAGKPVVWVTFKALGESTGLSGPEMMTRNVARLAQLGLVFAPVRVSRQEAQELKLDPKSKKIHLTQKGIERAKEMYDTHCGICADLYNNLPPDLRKDVPTVDAIHTALLGYMRDGMKPFRRRASLA